MPCPPDNTTTALGDPIVRAQSTSTDPEQVAADLAEDLGDVPAAARIVFVSPGYDLDALAAALSARFGDAPLLGCTTAGEIGPDGYLPVGGVSAVGLPADDFSIDPVVIRDLREADLGQIAEAVRPTVERHLADERTLPAWTATGRPPASFGMLLTDGLSGREEVLVNALNGMLGAIPIGGGSAGDGVDFGATHVLADGRFEQNAAVLLLARTCRPFERFRNQHFVPTETKVVVTEARPDERLVIEIDGYPAAVGYAEACGIPLEELDENSFSTHPVVVSIGGEHYVRSVQKVEDDQSLRFYCAIEEGLVLTMARGIDMVDKLDQQIEVLVDRLGEIELTLGFDCILRRLESQERDLIDDVDRALRALRCAGFATYGEQYDGMHVNQTMTGIAIGQLSRAGRA